MSFRLLTEDYFLANEYTKAKNINTANISMFKGLLQKEDSDYENNYIEMGNCTFFNKKGKLAAAFKDYTRLNSTFDFSDYLPCNYMYHELELSETDLYKLNLVTEKHVLFGKKFYKINKEFFLNTQNCVYYVLNEKDFQESKSLLEGFMKVRGNKYFVWY